MYSRWVQMTCHCRTRHSQWYGSRTFVASKAVFWIRIVSMRIRMWIRIQHFWATSDPDPDPGFWWPKRWKNIGTSWIKNICIFLMKNCHFVIPRPSQKTFEFKSSTWKHEMTFFWVFFALLDPDPDPADQNQCGSRRSTSLKTPGNEREIALLREMSLPGTVHVYPGTIFVRCISTEHRLC
jgi:hypothetical protein